MLVLSLIHICKSEYALEVLKDVDEESIAEALKIVDAGIIDLKLNPITQGLYIKADVYKRQALIWPKSKSIKAK